MKLILVLGALLWLLLSWFSNSVGLKAEEITTEAEERTPSVFECSPSITDCPSQVGSLCTIWPLMNNLQNKVNGFLENLTLKDISE